MGVATRAVDLREQEEARGLLSRLPGFNPLWLIIAPAILVVLGLLVSVIAISFTRGLPGTPTLEFTAGNYAKLYTDPFVLQALSNTVGFAATSVPIALFFGLSLAWLVERTDLPGKSGIYTVVSLGLLLPSFFAAMGWLFLLSPRIGVINTILMDAFKLTQAPFDVTSVVGMGFVQGLNLSALAFVLTSASFRSMDPALEDAASVHGATFMQTVRRVIVPLVVPAVLASSIYILTISIATFDVPAILGLSNRIYTFSTFVFSKAGSSDGLPDYGISAAMSVFMIGIGMVLSVVYGRVIAKSQQYQVVTGKGYRPRLVELGAWTVPAWCFVGLYFLLSKVLPLSLLIWASLLPYFQPPTIEALSLISSKNFESIPWELLARGVSNTLLLIALVPTLALTVSFAFSWTVMRSNTRLRGLLDFVAFLPHVVPGIIFGVAAVYVTLFLMRDIPLYGTIWLLAIVYSVDRLSFGTRVLNSALIQIHKELEESAAISGATRMRIARSILVPLISPALLNGWLWMAIQTYRELTLATVLFNPANIVLSVIIWNIWFSGKFGQASAITLIVLAGLIPLVVLYFWLGRKQAPGHRMAGAR